ncbi:MAG: formate dehydrogenase accessory sulfurtransferase FdhD [Solirubrobacterales bacterium]|nr:formate dehydrogenase accessory sulfurtransferase FdhD [Solirubrobacterales bacterium]
MSRIAATRKVTKLTVGEPPSAGTDVVAGEEPLEIRIGGEPLAVTMRTPGHDFELAAGFFVSEGVISSGADFAGARYCGNATPDGPNGYNVLDVTLGPGVEPPATDLARNFYTTSSCGICGKASIEAIKTSSAFDLGDDQAKVDPKVLAGLPENLRRGQEVFDQTGGLHAAGLFDAKTGEALVVREDIGRHNAVDKVVGWALMEDRLPLSACVLQVSGRAGFELVQKAMMAGIPIFSAISAPSSLAVELATSAGMALIGFLRGNSMVIYSRPDRVTPDRATARSG